MSVPSLIKWKPQFPEIQFTPSAQFVHNGSRPDNTLLLDMPIGVDRVTESDCSWTVANKVRSETR
jgi:hypothetical protein